MAGCNLSPLRLAGADGAAVVLAGLDLVARYAAFVVADVDGTRGRRDLAEPKVLSGESGPQSPAAAAARHYHCRS